MNVAVLIKSCQKYADRRKACRDTWLTRNPIPAYSFVVADPTGGKFRTVEDDILVIDGISDSFQDIAPKVKLGLQFFVREGAEYIFVCDDDTYVETDRLLKNVPVGLDYVGCMRVADLEFNHQIPYASGSGYWLSRKAAALVAESGLMRPEIIDDGAVGQVLDGRVAFVHDRRYWAGPQPVDVGDRLISVHKCTPNTMKLVHDVAVRRP